MVKQRCGAKNLTCVVISQHTKIPKVPILVANEAIEEHHAPDLTAVFGAECIRIVDALSNIDIFDQPADWHIGCINIGKEPTGRREDTFPTLQTVRDSLESHSLCNLCCIVLAVWLISRVCPYKSLTGIALVQLDTIWELTPCFRQHAVGS